MKAPARVLLISTLISVLVVLIVLYRYNLLKPGESTEVNTSNNSSSSTEKTLVSTASKDQLENGKKLYESTTCVLCHGANGAADTSTGKMMKATNLAAGKFNNNKENLPAVQYISKVIAEGVPGTNMVSFKVQLPNEKDRHDLAEYVHSLSIKK